MDGEELQKQAESRAQELPGTELTHPFGLDSDVWKICGKMFMFHAKVEGEPQVILKALPSDSMSLRAAHADITPGYHMNKRHWVSVRAGEALSRRFVRELVVDSYRLVLEKLPRSVRPVDPETYGG